LDPWQRFVLDRALGESKDGKWSAFEVGLVVPRQNGKGSILEARELAGLFLFDERLILHSAHEFETARTSSAGSPRSAPATATRGSSSATGRDSVSSPEAPGLAVVSPVT
jgi:hypothetical protein